MTKKKIDKTDTVNTIKKRIAKDQAEWLEAFKNQWTIVGACKKIGINRGTYYLWEKKYPKFVEKKDEIEKEQIEYVESKLVQQIENGELGAIIFYLKCRSTKWRPTERREIEDKTKIAAIKKIENLLRNLTAKKNDYKRDAKNDNKGGHSRSQESSEGIIQK